jgi:signal transduction histidine kinase
MSSRRRHSQRSANVPRYQRIDEAPHTASGVWMADGGHAGRARAAELSSNATWQRARTAAQGESIMQSTHVPVESPRDRRASRDSLESEPASLAPPGAGDHGADEWTSLVAHDMRQPLSVIALCIDNLGSPDEDLATTARRIARIRSSVAALSQMIDDILEVAHVASAPSGLERQRVDLHALVREVGMHTARTPGDAPVEVTTHGDCSGVLADPRRLAQVLANLLSNAGKYGDGRRPVRVTLEGRATDVLVSVVNHGDGIAADEAPALFGRFHRAPQARANRRVTGHGLGLYICRRLIEAHGGRIWVESVPGEATAFRFTLPR